MTAIIGFDPGMTVTGAALIAVYDVGKTVATAEFSLQTSRGKAGLRGWLAEMLKIHGICEVVCEGIPFDVAHGRTAAQGQRISRAQARARGILREMAEAAGHMWVGELNVQHVKGATAGGGAGKDAIIQWALRRYGRELAEHAADALAVAHTHLKDKAAETLRLRFSGWVKI